MATQEPNYKQMRRTLIIDALSMTQTPDRAEGILDAAMTDAKEERSKEIAAYLQRLITLYKQNSGPLRHSDDRCNGFAIQVLDNIARDIRLGLWLDD